MFQKEIIPMKGVKELIRFLIIQIASISSNYANDCTVLLIFLSFPVTTAKAKQTFSKLELIKNYLRSTLADDRLSACHYL